MIVVKRQKKHSAIDQVDFRVPHQRNTYKKVELQTGNKIGISLILPQSFPKSYNNDQPAKQNHKTSASSLQKRRLVLPDKIHPVSMSEISLKAERVKRRLFQSE